MNYLSAKSILLWMGAALILIIMAALVVKSTDKNDDDGPATVSMSPITAEDHILGNATSTVTLVEYSDFQCPACAYYYPMVDRLVEEYKDRIRFVYRHFPLPQHLNAEIAGRASEAAANQGKFWEMYRNLFVSQIDWSQDKNADKIFEGYASSLGLDMEKYLADFASSASKARVNKDLNSGRSISVNSTPTFLINNVKITNPVSYEEFKARIDAALAE